MSEFLAQRAHPLSQKSDPERFQAAYDQIAAFGYLTGGYIGILPFNLDGKKSENDFVVRSGSVRAKNLLGIGEECEQLTYYEDTRTSVGDLITGDQVSLLSNGETVWTSRFKSTTMYDPSNNAHHPSFIRHEGRNSNWYTRREIDTPRLVIPIYVGQALEVMEYAAGLRKRNYCTVNRVSIGTETARLLHI